MEANNQIQELQLKRDCLIEEAKLKIEIIELESDIRDLGGDHLYNLQRKAIYLGLMVWGATRLVFSELFNLLDRYLEYINEPQTKKRITSKKRVRVLGVTSRN